AFDHVPEQAARLDRLMALGDFLHRPDIARRYVMQGTNDAPGTRLGGILHAYLVDRAEPPPRMPHEISSEKRQLNLAGGGAITGLLKRLYRIRDGEAVGNDWPHVDLAAADEG